MTRPGPSLTTFERLHRRRILRGLGLGSLGLALPPLEIFLDGAAGRAYAQAAPKSLMLFHFGNGAPMDYWRNLALPREGLGTMMARVTVVRGLSLSSLVNPLHAQDVNGHAAGCMTVMTNVPALPDPGDTQEEGHHYKGGGESFDQAANRIVNGGRPVRVWAAQTRFGSLKQSYLSHSKSGGLLPLVATREVMAAFGGVSGGSAPIDNTERLRRARVTTSIKRQVEALKKKLGAADRVRMDQYLASIAQLEATLGPPPQQQANTCVVPSIGAHTSQDSYNAEHVNNMFELCHRALQCDVTKILVFSLTSAGEGPAQFITGASGSGEPDHAPSHHENDAGKKEVYRKGTLWKLQRLADLLRKLDSDKGPDGRSVLDNTAVVAFSEMGEGNEHSGDDIATIVAGGGFRRPGEVIDAGGPMANMWLTAMRAIGIGDAQMPRWGNSTGPIAALL